MISRCRLSFCTFFRDLGGNAINRILWTGAQAICLSTCLVGVSSKLLTQTKQRYASTQAHLHAIAKAREYEHADSRSAYACIHLRRTCTTARTHSLMDPMHIYGACDRVSIERASICAYVHKYLGPSDCRLPPLPFLFVLSPATCTRGSKIQCIAPKPRLSMYIQS